MTPQEFMAKWGPGGPAYYLNEEQGAQSHFLDLCEVLGVPKPGTKADYLFEEVGDVIGGRKGYADVFMRNHFAWENKAPGKSLDTALKQLDEEILRRLLALNLERAKSEIACRGSATPLPRHVPQSTSWIHCGNECAT